MRRHIDRDHNYKFMAVPPYLPYHIPNLPIYEVKTSVQDIISWFIDKISHSDDNGVGRAGLVPLRDGGSKGCLRYFQPGWNVQSRNTPSSVSLSGNRALRCCSLQRFTYFIITSKHLLSRKKYNRKP